MEARLLKQIAQSGPITVADYMRACLTDPDGYYANATPFGAEGDFVTAPDVSQMFGELIGAWLVMRWQADGAPSPVNLVELGPGRGTLMADVLRTAGAAPAFLSAARLVLVEASPRLRAHQAQRLKPLTAALSFAEAIPDDAPLYVLANEYFDALPVRQFVRRDGRWFERTVGERDGRLAFGLSPFAAPVRAEAQDGAVLELRPAADAVVQRLAAAIARRGCGAALIVDYGHDGGIGGETLQAVRRHARADVLAAPGTQDLSAHVDFAALADAARGQGAVPHGPVTQGDFLIALGLLERAGALGASASPEARASLSAAVERLAGPAQMGSLFKVLAVTADAEPPLGFPVVAGESGC